MAQLLQLLPDHEHVFHGGEVWGWLAKPIRDFRKSSGIPGEVFHKMPTGLRCPSMKEGINPQNQDEEIMPVCVVGAVSAQPIRGNGAHIECAFMKKAGSTLTVTEMAKGQKIGAFSLASTESGQTEFHADLGAKKPQTTVLELLSGTNVVRRIPGPGPSGVDCDFEDHVAYSMVIRPEDDWVWLAVAAGVYLVSCADYIGGHEEHTVNSDGTSSTTYVSGHWEWNCGFPFMTVNVDGHDYHNITGLQFRSVYSGELPPVDVLNISAVGGTPKVTEGVQLR